MTVGTPVSMNPDRYSPQQGEGGGVCGHIRTIGAE